MLPMNTSLELSKKANEVMPGPHSNLPGYELFRPIYFARGSGGHLYDVDGNDFLDYMCGLGAGVIGYNIPEVVEVLKNQIDNMYYLDAARRSPLEIELAEKLVHHIPCAEKVRYLLSGTEAVQLVIRLARAYNKRPYFIRFDGHYHGWLDNVMGGMVDPYPQGPPHALYTPDDLFASKGRDVAAEKQSFKLPWNEIDVLESVLEEYGDQVSLIIMEPINANAGVCMPRPGYMERVRELCDKYGIILCFDEIITGFRVGLSGAQGYLGVTPDICTLGKGIAGGIPFSVVGGKAEIMDLLTDRKVVGAGTFNGYPLGVSAALATVKYLEKDNGVFYNRLEKVQNKLMDGLREIAQKYSEPMLLQGAPGVFFYQFLDKDVAYNVSDWYPDSDHAKQERLREELFVNGILILFRARWYISGSHTEEDVDRTLEIVDRAMKKIL